MKSVKNPVIIHYHLFPGGVSQLMLSGLQVLISQGLIEEGITFIIGSDERSEWFFKSLKANAPADFKLQTRLIPELSYWTPERGTASDAAETIQKQILEVLSPDTLIWAHNPTLGKNPAYALALKRLAIKEPNRPILMHVHDSAEQGRWPNLGLMRSELIETPYFITPGTRWLFINKTDESFFRQAGMPAAFLLYFPDMIAKKALPTSSKLDTIRQSLMKYAEQHLFVADLSEPWALFAGRTIRRKNLLETLLIQLCSERPMPLLVTLPSDSPDDKPYEDALFSLMRKFKAGIAGFGPSLVNQEFSLTELASAATVIQSGSVMEGFGLPYLEFPRMGRPLFARRIQTMRDFEYASHAIPHHYYDSFRVPLSLDIRNNLKDRYFQKVTLLGDKFGIRGWRRDSLFSFFETHFKAPAVDFSMLSFSEQHRLLDSLDDKLRKEIRSINSDAYAELKSATEDQSRSPLDCAEAVDSCFGEKAYGENFKTVLESVAKQATLAPEFSPYTFAQRLFESYFAPNNLRLLLDYKPYLSTTL